MSDVAAIEPGGQGPLYARVAGALRDGIVGGTWPVGAQLPTEDELTARFAVSRFTVREALRRLREEGLVSSRQGAGTVVLPPPRQGTLHATSIDDLLAFARDLRFEIDRIGLVTADEALALRIGEPEGSEWLAVGGLRLAGGEPVCRTDYHIHRDYAAVADRLRGHDGPVFPLIEEMFGVRVAEVEQAVSAGLVPPVLGPQLGIGEGDVVLEVHRAFRDADGRLVQHTVNTHPAARFRHSMTLTRVSR